MNVGDDLSALERLLYGDVEGDPELEAELRSLEIDEATTNADDDGGKIAGRSSIIVADGNAAAVSAAAESNEQDDEADDSVDNDEQLVSELASLMDGKEAAEPVTNISSSNGGIRVSLSEVEERIQNYDEAAKEAEASKNFGKLRRVRRGLAELRKIHQILRTNSDATFEFVPPKVAVRSDTSPVADRCLKASDLQSMVTESAPSAVASEIVDAMHEQMSNEAVVDTEAKQIPAFGMKAQFTADASTEESSTASPKATATEEKNPVVVVVVEEEQCNEPAKMDCAENTSLSNEVASKEKNERAVEMATADEPVVGAIGDAGTQRACSKKTECEEPKKTANASSGMVKDLEARMAVYKAAAEAAQAASNSSKVRRMERIVKQYQAVIAAINSGKAYHLSDLPVPPGFEPFNSTTAVVPSKPSSEDVPQSVTAAGQACRYRERMSSDPKPSDFGISACCSASATKAYREEKQLQMMNIRLDQYKRAVLKARDDGNLAEAKELLKSIVRIKRLIRAFNSGCAVDLSLLPKAPPTPKGSGVVSSFSAAPLLPSAAVETDKKPLVTTSRDDIYASLLKDLITQVQICDLNIEFAKRTGHTSECKFFENLRLTCKGDLIFVSRAHKLEEPPPKFRYEAWKLPSLKSLPHIGCTEMEVHVCRALDIQLPAGYESKHADLFVSLEFPYPRDRPQVAKTSSVKGTTSPVFGHVHKFVINPASRVMQLMMKRHGLKFEVYQKGSLFRSGKLLGSAELKLCQFESECEIEETLTLVANKKVVTGKLVVKALIREPLLHKSDSVLRQWLIIDQGEQH
ncbi:C2 domain protein [Trichuris suis]|nr:C2 domain protein [Trichuris suis]